VDLEAAVVRALHVWIAADAGRVIDADGIVNQLEGGAVQSLSWTLKEAVTFDADGVTSRDWQSYPILRFSEVPRVATSLLDRPRERPLGAGEATQGPTAAATANAVAAATGIRVRDLPLTPARLRASAGR
jgi:CO/xanthine dehydrogenase Mo-binding subunit